MFAALCGVEQRHLELSFFFLESLNLTLIGPHIEQSPVRRSSLILLRLCIGIIYWTGYTHQIPTVGTGTVEVPPSYVVVFKGCHNVEDSTATGTGVDGA